jgi:hypothetical protein
MQQRTNAESIRAESEKVRQANEERLREKRMVRVPLFLIRIRACRDDIYFYLGVCSYRFGRRARSTLNTIGRL